MYDVVIARPFSNRSGAKKSASNGPGSPPAIIAATPFLAFGEQAQRRRIFLMAMGRRAVVEAPAPAPDGATHLARSLR